MYKRVVILSLFIVIFIAIWSPVAGAINSEGNTLQPVASEYKFPWPGILPDNPLYKIKVLRNKIIYKIIYSPAKKVEFDLLMADKTLYSSKLLLEKGNIALAKETALKGENYFSILDSDYAVVLSKKQKIPEWLEQKIKLAFVAHQNLIDYLIAKSSGEDRKLFTDVKYFSTTNYQTLLNLQDKARMKSLSE